jgi:hypothetical protein
MQLERTSRRFQNGLRFHSFVEFWEYISPQERIMVDYLRTIVLETLPPGTKEKLTFNVPYYYGKRRICLIWPGSIPCGGFKKGVMLGMCQGNRLQDPDGYLTHGTNKQIFYRIYQAVEEIEKKPVIALLKEAILFDNQLKK